LLSRAGTKYLHEKGVAHRDLSLENAMLSGNPAPSTVKIIDFGLAVRIPEDGSLVAPDGKGAGRRGLLPKL
jgi:serine/threonine protein kinase